jgi:PIN domain nuclease of toxin-antitoxin system
VRAQLDSHAYVWWISTSSRLSSQARDIIENGEIFVSAASAYELAAKAVRAKLPGFEKISVDFETICAAHNFVLLPITIPHALTAANLTTDRRDPFDRLIAAPSLVEDLTIVTFDPAFKPFGCKTIWLRALTLGRADNRQSSTLMRRSFP